MCNLKDSGGKSLISYYYVFLYLYNIFFNASLIYLSLVQLSEITYNLCSKMVHNVAEVFYL